MDKQAVIRFEMKVPVDVKQEGNLFVTSCVLLDVHSQGYTEEEALENIVDALQLFIVSCYERGTLDEVLSDCGFELADDSGLEPEDGRTVTVPLPLVAARHAETHAH